MWVDLEEELNVPFRTADYLTRCPVEDIQNPIISHTTNTWLHLHKKRGNVLLPGRVSLIMEQSKIENKREGVLLERLVHQES